MFKDQNLKQEGGESSTNLQGQNVNIYNGITYSDAKEIAIDVFKTNFLQLSQDAANIAKQRAEELTEEFLMKLEEKSPESIAKINDPDVQFALFSAQQEYARSGEKDLEEMLVDILIERIENDNQSLKKIVLNEALKILPKITNQQLDILTLTFLIQDTVNNSIVNIDTLKSYLYSHYVPFLDSLTTEKSTYKHLQFTGCCGSIGLAEDRLSQFFINHYPGIFSKGFEKSHFDLLTQERPELQNLIMPSFHDKTLYQLNVLNEDVLRQKTLTNGDVFNNSTFRKLNELFKSKTMDVTEVDNLLINICPEIRPLLETWQGSYMCTMNPTSVGTALAYINFKRKTGIGLNLNIWIK